MDYSVIIEIYVGIIPILQMRKLKVVKKLVIQLLGVELGSGLQSYCF